jgi:diguanylate cyclase (GGDEF)-like protein
MVAILDASRLLSRETRLDRLHAAVVEQLTGLTGATDVLVVVRDEEDGSWSLPFRRDGGPAVRVEEAGAAGLLPVTAFRYAERTGEILLVDDAVQDSRFDRDPYLAGVARCALLAVPLAQGVTRTVLVLTHRHSAGWFTADRLDAVMLLTGQLVVSLGNALLYEALEKRVAARTEALAQANRQLEVLSSTDALTGLANRRHFATAMEQEWRRSLRSGRPLSVVMVDVDHFKRYNDTFGHPQGDECLRQVAGALRTDVRAADVVCRYGGEEFATILPETDRAGALAFAERARHSVLALNLAHPAGATGLVTVSVGLASTVPSPVDTCVALVERADRALYEAKKAGRNRVQAAPPDPAQAAAPDAARVVQPDPAQAP